jgi:uncharacterized protein YaeQ
VALTATLHRFRIELSDVARGVYESLDLRVARHPSESEPFLLTRVLAYALSYEEGLEFSPGLSTEDEAAISLKDPSGGGITLWIDIGNPSPRRLNKASKASRKVKVYTYKDPENLLQEAQGERIHRAGAIEILAFDAKFLDALSGTLGRDNSWGVIHNDGVLTVTIGDASFETVPRELRLPS